MSLYEPVYTEGGDTLYVMDQISDKKNKEDHWVEQLSLSEAMKHLNDREREIISLRFFEGKTQMEVASEIGVPLKEGYNGDLTSAQAGSIGGEMVKKMIMRQEEQMSGK